MGCSWKFVVLLVFASMTVQYVVIQTLTSTSYLLCPAHSSTNPAHFSSDLAFKSEDLKGTNSTSRTHVLILATTRCGSTFTGQLLNQHPDVFCLFEPLFHVQDSLTGRFNFNRELILGANRDLFWSLFRCDLYALERYIRPAPTDHMVHNLFFQSYSRTLTQPPVCQKGPCNPVNLTRVAQACRGKSHVAYKTVRVVVVGELRPLLEDPRLNIKVIQLVRDPRGILNSRIETFSDWYKTWKLWKSSGHRPASLHIDPPQFSSTCHELHSSLSTALSRPDWLRGRYMLVRYEDLSRNPLQKTKEIYDFVGLSMTPSVEEWIRINTRAADVRVKDKYGTRRDSAANAESWRLELPFDMVQHVQAECRHALSIMGYREVQSAQELRNMNVSLVQDKTFEPFG